MLQRLGIAQPKVGIVAAVETVNPATQVPIALTSRADSLLARAASVALAVLTSETR